ncbi:MAG: GntR family transcriptional regulator [Ruminococcaceae bacterium]|nr:GntR family transcriptional regulator [Oscillospiraceae bacterium]
MDFKLDKSRAICPQIYDRLCAQIASGQLSPDERLPSVRELALILGVNPNTVQKAFENLEKDGILYSLRGSGWFVSQNVNKARTRLNEILNEKTASYFNEMKALGQDSEAVKNYIKEWCE